MKGGSFFQLYYDDLMQSIREKRISPEQTGMLIAIMCKQWEIGGPVAPELLSGFANWDMRMVKRLVGLLAAGKHIEVAADGKVSSARMTVEIIKYQAKVAAAEAARAAHKAGKSQTSVGDVSEMSGTLPGDHPKKDNEISQNSKPPAGDIESDIEEEKEKDSPLPPAGGAPSQGALPMDDGGGGAPAKTSKRKPRKSAADRASAAERFRALALELREIYNRAAEHFGFHRVQVWTDARDARHVARVIEIGGKENYRKALFAIRLDPFLSGKVPPKPGQTQFVLDWDKLMQTQGNMGDVLAKLLELASRPTQAQAMSPGPNGRRWGWWSEMDVNFDPDIWRMAFSHDKGADWQWWNWGPPVGHKDCFVPPEIINECNLIARYGEAKHA